MSLYEELTVFVLSVLFSCSSNEDDETLSSVSSKSEISTIQNNNHAKSGESELDPFLTVEFLPNSTARYLITEQLANLDFPIDAIGETNQINGSINFDENGKIIQQNSTIIVNVNSLKSVLAKLSLIFFFTISSLPVLDSFDNFLEFPARQKQRSETNYRNMTKPSKIHEVSSLKGFFGNAVLELSPF